LRDYQTNFLCNLNFEVTTLSREATAISREHLCVKSKPEHFPDRKRSGKFLQLIVHLKLVLGCDSAIYFTNVSSITTSVPALIL